MTNKGVLLGLVLIVIFGCSNIYAADPSSSTMQLTCPYWYGTFDAAGFSDDFYWDNSPYHPHDYHELLSGEWGAAIYYDGISTDPNAMWMTDYFLFPYWPTLSNFEIDTSCSGWNDQQNPVDGYDTGRSVIKNSEVEITIDYEIADIGSSTYSPTVYHEPNESPAIAKSERYVLLKTYTIKNIKASGNITGLEFYQMLHSHGADDYGPAVHCSYNSIDVNDPLENYTPYNNVHTAGNFRYDITQWNNPDDPNSDPQSYPVHTDWVGFSSTVEPNVFECGYYVGNYSGRPQTGTHVNIEDRNLNDANYAYGETAGAMGWYLPDLEPDETTSITIAFMFATTDWPFPTLLTKANADPNNDCVRPFIGMGIEDNYLTYDICYDANGYALYDVNIIDYLPIEVDYYSSDPAGTYDSNTHTVTWNIGDLSENDSNCIELVTKVNYYAKPGGIFTNEVRMECSEGICAEAATDVNVCYDGYGMSIIYVDKDANGFNNGTSWDNAYTDLRDAFTGAESGGASVTAIWVAEGTYKPVYDTNDSSYKNESFNLLEDVGVFGHFGGVGTYETSTTQRVFSDSNNTTILEGQIGDNYYDAVKYIVKAKDIDDGLIDGFTIRGSYGLSAAGIYLDGSDISVVNCKLKENDDYGIYAKNYSYPDVHNCLFLDNTSCDIYSGTSQPDISYCTIDGNDTCSRGVYLNSGSVSNISHTHIKDHTGDGIYGSNATITLTNSKILGSNDNGVEGYNSDVTVEKTVFDDCTDNAIYLTSYSDIDISRSVVRNSGEHGIYLYQNSGTSIINNWIHNNGKDQISSRASGIYFYNQIGIPLVRNNTIYDNYTYGIESTETGADPNILNCIIYGNDSNDLYRVNDTFDTVNYCNLQNSHAGIGNITGDPGFKNVGTYPNDLHLDETSQCKDAGDPNGDYDETDIDGENRIYYGRVDMGADEYYWSPADFDEDGYVNFIDYAIFAAAWQSESGKSNYNEDCDLENNNSIDMNDLALFCEDWLWEKAWDEGWMMCMGGGSTLKSMMMESSFLSLTPTPIAPSAEKGSDGLMLSGVESQKTMPKRLAAKSEKFYKVTPEAIAKLQAVRPKPPTKRELYELHQELLKWLDEICLSGDLKETMTEEQYLEFRKAVEDSLQ